MRTDSAPWEGERRLRAFEAIQRGLPVGSVVVLRTAMELEYQRAIGGVSLQPPRQEAKAPRDYVVDGIGLLEALFQELGPGFQREGLPARPRSEQTAERRDFVMFDLQTRTFCLRRAGESGREWEFRLSDLFDVERQQTFSERVSRLPEGERLANQLAYLMDAFFDYTVPLIRVVSDDVQGVLASLSIPTVTPELVVDPAVKQAERYSQQATADIEGKTLVPSRGITTTGSAMATGKRVVRFFVSYAHADRTLVEALVKELNTRFAASARYELQPWIDRDILVGERWKELIAKYPFTCK
ncbi:MAG: toll/interleukin-1 receptor domain-containing protein [Myxococcaceae bacterium]|nr:toll/interleukin-1 receptor domain-containing protein [Myxococcaceae bacterium]